MQPKVYLPDEHRISADLIDPDALNILRRLRHSGYEAYLVGGSVRDLLLNRVPKDFDISTSAKPEEIKRLFRRNCLLIGRRFRLAHLRFGSKIFEVSTFRSGNIDEDDLILRDNNWGSAEEDAIRRDFTINGLYYNPEDGTVIDFVGGCQDIFHGLIRTIGEPEKRFKQDPVRMLRLLKFQARFGFQIEAKTEASLKQTIEEITKSAPARILEEIFRMLESGASAPFFSLLSDYGLLEQLLPPLADFLRGPHGHRVLRFLEAADRVMGKAEGPRLSRSALTSALLYPILEKELETQAQKLGEFPGLGEIIHITSSIIRAVAETSFFQIPRKLRVEIGFILHTQFRLTPPEERRPRFGKLLKHPDLPLALEFLYLRSKEDADLEAAYQTWNSQTHPREMSGRRHSRRRRPRRSVRKGSSTS